MSPTTTDHPTGASNRDRRSSVKARLTPNPRRRSAENDEYASFIHHVVSYAPTPGEWRRVTLTPWPT